jgi:hypothetical protein
VGVLRHKASHIGQFGVGGGGTFTTKAIFCKAGKHHLL